MGQIKYCHDLTKQEYREFKQFCKDEQQQKSLQTIQEEHNIPPELVLNKGSPGVVLACQKNKVNSYIGLPQGSEGHVIVVGGSGSGKSLGVCKPTISAWKESLCVTDIKGELSSFYQELQQQGLVTRPFIKFDPMQEDSPGYDPFYWLSKDGADNLVTNIWEIVLSIIPLSYEDKEPFWTQSEQAIFAAALHYFYNQNMDFNEIILALLGMSLSELLKNIIEGDNIIAKMYIGEITKIKSETLFSIDRGLRNKLIPFVTNTYVQRALRSKRKGEICFDWDDLENSNIFLCVPEDKMEQFGSMVNLMYSQLIRHLERRPDKYSQTGGTNTSILLLFDEFARFGKLSSIAAAISTLRSKCVNICLILQSLAQLDKVYGKDERRIILDNCQYIALLRANDLDTQKYFSELIGTQESKRKSYGESSDEFGDIIGHSEQSSETRVPIIYSHELSTLNDVLLLSPYGFYRADKITFNSDFFKEPLESTPSVIVSQLSDEPNKEKIIHAKAYMVSTSDRN